MMVVVSFLLKLFSQYWAALTLLALAGITVGSLMPLAEMPLLPGSDKTHHLVGYAVLVFCTALRRPQYWLYLVLGFALWSGAIELIQPYVNRYGEWQDLVANCIGLLLGICLAQLARYCLRKGV
ncbi:MAG: VanZ family protein [Arenicella sp.]|jgi:VanZ family protein